MGGGEVPRGDVRGADPDGATALVVNDGGLVHRTRKLCLFLERPVMTSSPDKGSDIAELLDVAALLIRLPASLI